MHRPTEATGRFGRRSVLVGIVGGCLAVAMAVGFLRFYGDETGFLHLPELDPDFVGHVESMIRPAVVAANQGHDGKYFFLQSQDPWLVGPFDYFSTSMCPFKGLRECSTPW